MSHSDIHTYLENICDAFNEMPAHELATLSTLSHCFNPLLNSAGRTHVDSWSRMSGIGKPTIISAINKHKIDIGFKELDDTIDQHSPRMQTMFLWGNLFEEWIIKVGTELGWWTVRNNSQQQELVYDAGGVNIYGHIDSVLETPHGAFVFECKTLSPNYARIFCKQPDDDRGYLTQLALYSTCLTLPGFWLVLDKGTGLLSVVELPQNSTDRIKRLDVIVPHINRMTSLEEIVNTISLPPLVEEKYKRGLTGRYTLPESIKYWKYADVFYEFYFDVNGYNKPTKYIGGYREPDEVLSLMRSIGF